MVENSAHNEITNSDVMEFLKEHMVMNEDFQGFKKNVDEQFKQVDERFQQVATKKDIEGFDARLAEIQLEIESVKSRLDDIEQRLKDDTDALAIEVQDLRKRVIMLEKQFGIHRSAQMV